MPDNDLTAELDRLSKIEQAATPGPWWSDESDDCWRLHGVAFKVPPQLNPDGSVLIPEQLVNKQIAKAPKRGTPYAEYWPEPADAEFIAESRFAMPRLLAALRAVLELADELEHVETGPPSGREDEAAALGLRWSGVKIREAITRALNGGTDG